MTSVADQKSMEGKDPSGEERGCKLAEKFHIFPYPRTQESAP